MSRQDYPKSARARETSHPADEHRYPANELPHQVDNGYQRSYHHVTTSLAFTAASQTITGPVRYIQRRRDQAINLQRRIFDRSGAKCFCPDTRMIMLRHELLDRGAPNVSNSPFQAKHLRSDRGYAWLARRRIAQHLTLPNAIKQRDVPHAQVRQRPSAPVFCMHNGLNNPKETISSHPAVPCSLSHPTRGPTPCRGLSSMSD